MSEWRVLAPAQLGILAFRYAPRSTPAEEADALNRALVEELRRDGLAFISSTRLRGRTVLRICSINPRTTETDIESTIERLDLLARSKSSHGSAPA